MDVLPDILTTGLKVVFCGTAAGKRSAAVKAYYAGPGNQFWNTLHTCGLTDRVLKPSEFPLLLIYGIGLTDLAKRTSGADSDIAASHYDVDGFNHKLRLIAPKAIAFNGKKSAETYLGRPCDYGRQPETIGQTALFVLPSTSGAARGFWDIAQWHELAEFVR